MKKLFIPDELLEDKEVSCTTLRVFMILALKDQRENLNGEVEVSREVLLKLSRTCARTFKRGLDELESKGWLKVEKSAGRGAKNLYKIFYKKEGAENEN